MNTRLQEIVHKHETKLNEWYDFVGYYQDQFVLPYNPDIVDDFLDEPISIESVLQQLLAIFVEYGRKGGPWEKHESLDYGTGFSTGIICRHIDHRYIIGVDKTSIYFETPVAYPQAGLRDATVRGTEQDSRTKPRLLLHRRFFLH